MVAVVDKSSKADKRKWVDVSHETSRTYVFPSGDFTIRSPHWLCVEDGSESWHGAPAHRIVSADGESFYIPMKWNAIRWFSADGVHFVK